MSLEGSPETVAVSSTYVLDGSVGRQAGMIESETVTSWSSFRMAMSLSKLVKELTF